MSIVLRHQLEACERSVRELEEQLRTQARGAALRRDFEDLMRNLVQNFNDLNRNVERWQEQVRHGDAKQREALSALSGDFEQLYRKLDATMAKTATLIATVERSGYSIDGRREFLSAFRELKGITAFSLERVERASGQLDRGEGRELREILDELQAPPLP